VNALHRHRDLWLILLVAVLALLAYSLSDSPPLRAIASLPLLFFASGYTLLAALSQRPWDWVTALVVSVGLSLALLVGGGLVFHQLGLPIQSPIWWAWLMGQIGLCSSLAAWRRASAQPQPSPSASWLAKPRLVQVLPLALASVIILAAWVFGTVGQLVQHQQTFTQLWMIPCTERACDLEIGVRNYEWRPKEFRLELMANTRVVEAWTISLAHDEIWQTDVNLPADLPLGVTLLARLYRTEEPQLTYRFVTLRPSALNP